MQLLYAEVITGDAKYLLKNLRILGRLNTDNFHEILDNIYEHYVRVTDSQ